MFSNILLGAFIIAAFGSGECTVTITTPDKGNGTASTQIAEGAKNGTVETIAATTDVSKGNLTYKVVSPASDFEFANNTSGVLTVKSSALLDFETAATQIVLFSVSDGSTPTATGTLTVSITDINDNPPIFSQATYTVNVADKLKAGSSVVNVNATDADRTGANKGITYGITPASNNASFTISSTGAITVATGKSLSRASIPNYALIVLATDSGTKPGHLTGTATVSVCVGTSDECSSGAMSFTASLMSLIVTYVVYHSM